MGIYSRSYFRQTGIGGGMPPGCQRLIVVTVAVFLLQIFITRPTTPEDLRPLVDQYRPRTQKRAPRYDAKTPANNEPTASQGNEKTAATKPTPGAAEETTKPAAKAAAAPKPKSGETTKAGEKSKSDERAKPKEESKRDEKTKPDEKPASAEKSTPGAERKFPPRGMEDDDEYFGSLLLPSVSVVQEWLQLETDKVVHQAQIWRVLTCAFCHDRFSVWHILLNMLFLYWFGRMLEPMYGSREFVLFYLTAAVVASFCHIGLDLFTHHSVPAVGASGAVMAVVVLYAIHHPYDRVYVFMLVPIEIRWLVLLYVVIDLHPVLLALSGMPMYTGVANAAHLGGAAFGYLYWRYRWRLDNFGDGASRLVGAWRAGLQRKVRLHQPPKESKRDDKTKPDDVDALLDKILQKIHREGEASLTDVERAVLKIAADRRMGKKEP